MKISAQEEYGLRCLLRVAHAPDLSPQTLARVAEAEGLGTDYVLKLLQRLRQAGLLATVRGARGGYRLARPAARITVWEALAPLGAPLLPEDFCDCHSGRQRDCVRLLDCSLRALWSAVDRSVRGVLEGVTLADLLRNESAMEQWLDLEVVPNAEATR